MKAFLCIIGIITTNTICVTVICEHILQRYTHIISILFFVAVTPQWCLLDLAKINILLENVACPECAQTDVLRVTSGKRMGFAVDLHLICRECGHDFGGTYSSPEVSSEKMPSPFAVNDCAHVQSSRTRTHRHVWVFSNIRYSADAPENISEEGSAYY